MGFQLLIQKLNLKGEHDHHESSYERGEWVREEGKGERRWGEKKRVRGRQEQMR
jgi:hypothetical protein